MTRNRGRSRFGLLVSAFGAVLLVVSVYLPWYGARAAASEAGLPGHHAVELTGAQALNGLAVALLVFAGLSLLDALFGMLAAASGAPDGAGGAVSLLGALAGAFVVYRMLAPAGGALAVTLREGAWMALLGSLAIALGGLWPQTLRRIAPSEGIASDVWSALTRPAPHA